MGYGALDFQKYVLDEFFKRTEIKHLNRSDSAAFSTVYSRIKSDGYDPSDQASIDDWFGDPGSGYVLLQTKTLKQSHALSTGETAKQRMDNYAAATSYAEAIRSDPRYTPSTRLLYGDFPPVAGGDGAGGIDPLDPDLRSGPPWTPLDTTAIAFNIYDAVVKGFLPARRPGRGGYIKKHPDRKSTIRVLDHQGQPVYASTDFVIERINRPKKERLNTQVTFDQLIAMFGTERMKLYSFRGKLLDCKTFDWMRGWEIAWDEVLRGERLAENIHRAYVLNKAKIYGGYMVSCQITEDATIEPVVPFSFTLLVTDDEPLPNLSLITAKDEALLAEKFEGTEEEFQAELAALRVNLSGGIYDYSQSLDTKDPSVSKQSNPDAD